MCNAQTNSPSVSEAVHATGKRGTKGVESEEISSNKVGKLKRVEGKEQLIIMIPMRIQLVSRPHKYYIYYLLIEKKISMRILVTTNDTNERI